MTQTAVTKERPILFSGNMVRAILDGTKTQTRRVVKPQPYLADNGAHWLWDGHTCASMWATEVSPGLAHCCPYGKPGDRLWVRETFFCNSFDYPNATEHARENLLYRADAPHELEGESVEHEGGGWKPSIHMPRWASRLTLEVVSVRVERVQDISEADAITEGCLAGYGPLLPHKDPISSLHTARDRFRALWDSINAKRGFEWSENPFVWVIKFKRLESQVL